jgi:hypothetical protein
VILVVIEYERVYLAPSGMKMVGNSTIIQNRDFLFLSK